MRHSYRSLLITTTVLCLFASVATARDVDIDLRTGYYFDADGAVIGGGILMPFLVDAPQWYFNPNVEFVPGDYVDIVSINVDFHYDFAVSRDATFWAGGGPGIYIYDFDHPHFDDHQETDIGLNLIVGFGMRRGSVRPFIQGKGVFIDNAESAIAVGVRF